MKVHLLQYDIAWEDKSANHRKVAALLAEIRPTPGELVVLPEMFSTGFSMNLPATVQSSEREDELFMRGLAQSRRAQVLGGVVSPAGPHRGRNEAVVIGSDGQVVARYGKRQPFSLAGENAVHEAGDSPRVWDYQGFTLSALVCYDLRFPEHFREATGLGANVLIIIASWPSKRQRHWRTLLEARAIENQAYVLGLNRCGTDPSFTYAGGSVILNPQGEVLAEADATEQVLSAELSLTEVTQWRQDFPALQDRR